MSIRRRYTKMTCKIGTFYFFNNVCEDEVRGKGEDAELWHVVRDHPLSHMRVVRDAVMAKVLNPKIDKARPIRSTEQLYNYTRDFIGGPASKTRFLFIPAPGVWIKRGKEQKMGKHHRNVRRVA